MTTATGPRSRTTARTAGGDQPAPADVLVVFGITGDLAKVMTFRSRRHLGAVPGPLRQAGPAAGARRLVRDVMSAIGERAVLLITHRPEGLELTDRVYRLG